METEKKLYNIYKNLYGDEFNRLLTVGNAQNGYTTYKIQTAKELCEEYSKYNLNKDLFISIYDFDTNERINHWDTIDDEEKFLNAAKKNCIVLRFKENIDSLNEELSEAEGVQKFILLRRFLTFNGAKDLFKEVKAVSKFIKNTFNIKPIAIYNGFAECILYIQFDEIKFKNPALIFYYFNKFLMHHLNLTRLYNPPMPIYTNIVALPEIQNTHSRLYVKMYDVNWTNEEIIKNSEQREIQEYEFKKQDTEKLEESLKIIDKRLTIEMDKRIANPWDYKLEELYEDLIQN